MGRIPEEVIEQVRQASDIVDVIDSVVPLKRAGTNYKALSPFNQEKTPSFFVSPSKQIFKDFSSGHGGGVFQFVMLYENVDFPTAVRRLAERAGIAVPEEALPEDERGTDRGQREKLFELHTAATNWFKRNLLKDPAGEPGRAYLKGREITAEMAKEFNLGYAPDAWDATLNWGQQHGFNQELLELAGLATRNDQGRVYDRFRGRLMFPISDETGRVIGFSGRLLDPEAKAAKYVNSPDTPIFHKSKVLYGLHKTRRDIQDAGRVVVAEGQLDLIRCYVNGVKNVVAPQGTAFTEQHGRLLRRFTGEVMLCFDADNAGQNAAARSVEVLLPAGLQIRIATMPEGEDPDSMLRAGRKDEFLQILEEAPDFIGFLLEGAVRSHDLGTARGRGDAAARMAEVAGKITDPVQLEHESLRIATRLQIPLESFRELLRRQRQRGPREYRREGDDADAPAPVERIELDPALRRLASLLLHHPEAAPTVQGQLDPAWTEALAGQDVLWRLLQTHADDAWEDADTYVRESPPAEANELSALLLRPESLPEDVTPEQYALGILATLQQHTRLRRRQLLEQQSKSGQLSPEEANELMNLRRAEG
ncbi:MAG: DNA primase [Verrucomicrobiota bacterium]